MDKIEKIMRGGQSPSQESNPRAQDQEVGCRAVSDGLRWPPRGWACTERSVYVVSPWHLPSIPSPCSLPAIWGASWRSREDASFGGLSSYALAKVGQLSKCGPQQRELALGEMVGGEHQGGQESVSWLRED